MCMHFNKFPFIMYVIKYSMNNSLHMK